jgi:hypothetical protein
LKSKKKKSIKEQNNFMVSMTKNVGGREEVVHKEIQAATADQAVRMAKQGDPTPYSQINVAEPDGTMDSGIPKTDSRSVSGTEPLTTPKGLGESKKKTKKKTTKKKKTEKRTPLIDVDSFELTSGYKAENFDYPYSLSLPESFSKLTETVVENTNGIKTKEKYSRIYVNIENGNAMTSFMKNLIKESIGTDKKNKLLSETIIRGIMEAKK